MDRQVGGVVCFGVVAMVAVVTSPQLLDVVWCSAIVVVAVVVVVVSHSGVVVAIISVVASAVAVVVVVWCN